MKLCLTALYDAKLWVGDTGGLVDVLRARAKDAPPATAAARFAQLARCLEQTDAPEEALSAWTRARTADPTMGGAWDAEADLLEKLGKKEALLDQLQERAASVIVGTEDTRLPLLVRTIKLAMETGDSKRAIAAAEQASQWAAGNDEVSKLLVLAYASAEPKKEEPAIVEPPMVVAPPPVITSEPEPEPEPAAEPPPVGAKEESSA